MAEGLDYFLERFGKAYKIKQWKVFHSFDPKVTYESESSRRTKLPVATIANEVAENLDEAEKSKLGLETGEAVEAADRKASKKKDAKKVDELVYADLERLVRESVSSDAEVKTALHKATSRVAQAYEQQVSKQGDYVMDVVSELKLSFAEDPAFREEFEAGLRDDHHAAQDFDEFWLSIDALLSELRGVRDPRDEKARELMVALQGEVVLSFILACLQGARDYRQNLGHKPDDTPGVERGVLSGSGTSVRAQLVGVQRTGEGSDDFALPSSAVELELYELDKTRRARIGRNRSWCEGAGTVAVVTKAAFASGRHAEIEFDNGEWWLSDCSKNGTLVTRAGGGDPRGAGGAKAEFVHGDSVKLHHGDLICLAPQPNAELIGPRYLADYEGAKNYRFELL